MADRYDGLAIGIFEVDSLVAAFVALDEASKAADVKIQAVERNRVKSGACVKMRGDVSNVKAAMEVAIRVASQYGTVTGSNVIASPGEGTDAAMKMTIGK